MTDVLGPRLGRGWQFPVRPHATTGALPLVHGAELIRQSLLMILLTEPGERIMRPEFGCGLRRHLMAPDTPAARSAIGSAVRSAITDWEPRVRVTAVDVIPADDPAILVVTVAYVHVRDGSTGGLQVPLRTGGGRS